MLVSPLRRFGKREIKICALLRTSPNAKHLLRVATNAPRMDGTLRVNKFMFINVRFSKKYLVLSARSSYSVPIWNICWILNPVPSRIEDPRYTMRPKLDKIAEYRKPNAQRHKVQSRTSHAKQVNRRRFPNMERGINFVCFVPNPGQRKQLRE